MMKLTPDINKRIFLLFLSIPKKQRSSPNITRWNANKKYGEDFIDTSGKVKHPIIFMKL